MNENVRETNKQIDEYHKIVSNQVQNIHLENPMCFTTSVGTTASYYASVYHIIQGVKRNRENSYHNFIAYLIKNYPYTGTGEKGIREDLLDYDVFYAEYKNNLETVVLSYLEEVDRNYQLTEHMSFSNHLISIGEDTHTEFKGITLAEHRITSYRDRDGRVARMGNNIRNLYYKRLKNESARTVDYMSRRAQHGLRQSERMDRVIPLLRHSEVINYYKQKGIKIVYNKTDLTIGVIILGGGPPVLVELCPDIFNVSVKGTYLLKLSPRSYLPRGRVPEGTTLTVNMLKNSLELLRDTNRKYNLQLSEEQLQLVTETLIRVYDMRYKNVYPNIKK